MSQGVVRIAAAILVSFFSFGVTAVAQSAVDLEQYRSASTERWQKSIKEFDEKNQAESHPDDSVLFVGSSSIRLWDTIGEDMAPYHPIQRGFGGSRWSDVAVFAEPLITPHTFRAAVFFVANDITGRNADKTPEEVAALFRYVHGVVREHNADAPVFYIAVTPTESRWDVWPKIRQGNELIREYCRNTPNTFFIGTESIYIGAEGTPQSELFRDDKLHLSRDGYKLWGAAIKSQLDSVLGGAN